MDRTFRALLYIVMPSSIILLLSHFAYSWPLELIASQTPLFYTLALIACLLAIIAGAFKSNVFNAASSYSLVVILVVLTTLPAIAINRHPIATQDMAYTTTSTIRYATYNKLYTNTDLPAAAQYFIDNDIDIISFQEVTAEDIIYFMNELGYLYSYITENSASAFGSEIGLVSRYPITSSAPISLSGGNTVSRTVIRLPDGSMIAVYSVHILPPFYPSEYDRGLRSFEDFAVVLRAEELPTLVAGDFNTTIYSPKMAVFTDTVSKNNIYLSEAGIVPQNSWLTPGPSGLRMRIDHILHSDQLTLLGAPTIGPDTGSDHRIIHADFGY